MLTFKVGPQAKSTARQRENTQAIRGVMFAEGTKILCRDGLKWSRKGHARLFLLSLSFSLYLSSLPPSSFPRPLLSLLIPSALPARVTSGESHWSLFPKHTHLNLF